VLGSVGSGPLKGLLLGSVAHRLLQIAPCPVLVIPTGSTDFRQGNAVSLLRAIASMRLDSSALNQDGSGTPTTGW